MATAIRLMHPDFTGTSQIEKPSSDKVIFSSISKTKDHGSLEDAAIRMVNAYLGDRIEHRWGDSEWDIKRHRYWVERAWEFPRFKEKIFELQQMSRDVIAIEELYPPVIPVVMTAYFHGFKDPISKNLLSDLLLKRLMKSPGELHFPMAERAVSESLDIAAQLGVTGAFITLKPVEIMAKMLTGEVSLNSGEENKKGTALIAARDKRKGSFRRSGAG